MEDEPPYLFISGLPGIVTDGILNDVLAKKKRGIQYCEVASRWGKANGYKEWRYLFIPSKQVMPNSSFMQLAGRFKEV